ncbi:uncharacterized protein KY384_008683 [Bacidia gigantensis]|uniref:uncharacterized protein n=1 Tax=Bacidia gigantensis TaxID=2732470 RepID=UPI001D043714|nr:uncharacterized protein KY384_008683 [Bacidia gigantensis]KAG8526483.1 hypothetical protein KY384_008683 [Bacidia gigantensis]
MDERSKPAKDPFEIPNYWRGSYFSNLNMPLEFHAFVDDLSNSKHTNADLLCLPSSPIGLLEDVEPLEDFSGSASPDLVEFAKDVENDIWCISQLASSDEAQKPLRTWERFQNPDDHEFRTLFISEQSPLFYDTLLVGKPEGKTHTSCSGVSLHSLMQLGFGRQSILYVYDEGRQSFCARVERGRVPGIALETFHSLELSIIRQGNTWRQLQLFVTQAYTSDWSAAATLAVAHEISAQMSLTEAQVLEVIDGNCNILQLQHVFERTRNVLAILTSIVKTVEDARSEVELLSQIFETVKSAEHERLWVQDLFLKFLNAAARPWRTSVEAWIGLQNRPELGDGNELPSFVKILSSDNTQAPFERTKRAMYKFEHVAVPSFLETDDARLLFETGQSLRIICLYQPHHPLVRHSSNLATTFALSEWQSSWHYIEETSRRAEIHERTLRDEIAHYDVYGPFSHQRQTFTQTVAASLSHLQSSEGQDSTVSHDLIRELEQPLPKISVQGFSLVGIDLTDSIEMPSEIELLTPPLPLIPTLSLLPIAALQAGLVNQACIRMLFKNHGLQSHLELLYRYQLLGDGPFASRLSHALFDPELASAQRRKGYHRSGRLGLQMGYRDTWPPASSEMRLALMGILTESYFSPSYVGQASLFREEMPGGLSFAIREMSEADLQKCVDPRSIYALDFLRIQFGAPPPLDTVITHFALAKYDAIFNTLLRAKRVLFVLDMTSKNFAVARSSLATIEKWRLKFRLASHHFISSICAYFSEGILTHWGRFRQKLEEIENALDTGSQIYEDSIYTLKSLHEQILDEIMVAFFLRKRQRDVMHLLEEILGLILQTSNHMTAPIGVERSQSDMDLRKCYDTLQKQIGVFLRVCRGFSKREEDGGAINALLLRFEANDFYKR